MTRHPVTRAIRDADAALFDLYALPSGRGRIRRWIAEAISIATAAVAIVAFWWGLFLLAFAFGG